MNGRSTLKTLTRDYLFLQTTERSTLEIRFLPLINNTLIACAITTVYAPVAESRVEFFSAEWQPLPSTALWTPAHTNSFIKADIDRSSNDFQTAMSYIDIELVHYRLNPDNMIMEARFTTPDYLSREEREKLKIFLKDSTNVFYWEAGRFEIIHN